MSQFLAQFAPPPTTYSSPIKLFFGAAGSRVDIGRRSRVESAELRFGKETMLILLVIENDLESEKNKSHATSRSIFRVDMRYI